MNGNTVISSSTTPKRGFTINRAVFFSLTPLFIGALVLISLIFYLSRRPDLHPDLFFEDVSNFVDFVKYQQPYLGILTNVGIVFWFTGGAFCFLAASLFLQKQGLSRFTAFLFSVFVMGFYLGFDDFLLFHEHLFEVYLHIHEGVVFAMYGILGALFVVCFHREIRRYQMGYFLLFVALFLFSVLVDGIRPDDPMFQSNPALVMLEEGPKFLGVISFAIYCFRLSYQAIQDGFPRLNNAV